MSIEIPSRLGAAQIHRHEAELEFFHQSLTNRNHSMQLSSASDLITQM